MFVNDLLFRVNWSDSEDFALNTKGLYRDDGTGVEPFGEASSRIYMNRDDRRPIGDCAAVVGGVFVVSDNARRLIEKSNCFPHLRWIPVCAGDESEPLDANYWLVSTSVRYSILDEQRSTFDYYPGTKVIGQIHRWVVAGDKLKDYAFFYADYRWFVRRELKENIENENLTGFQFQSVEVWMS